MSSILKVNQIQDIGGNTLVSSNGTGGFTNNLPAGKSGAFRNIIINGDMSVAQRGTSQSSVASGYSTCDRWRTNQQSLGAFTQSQDTDVPAGQGFAKSLKMDCTTADASPATSDRLFIEQKFEGQNLQYLKKGTSSAESLTLSFWVKSNKTGTYIAQLYDVDNDRSISKSYTIDSASTWEKKTITFAGDTTGTLGNDNSHDLSVRLYLGVGTNYSSGTLGTSWATTVNANVAVGQVNLADSTDNEWLITGVQLEASGGVASDFEFLPYDVNLQRCYRYFRKVPNYTMNALATTSASGMPHIVTMRSTPTATWEQGGVTNRVYRITDAVTTTLTGASVVGNQHQLYYIYYVSSAWAMTSAQGSNGVLTDIEFSAEL